MDAQFMGCGDAFGSGGRFNACLLIDRGEGSFLIDCGASAMISLRRFGVDPNGIRAILLTHLHGDHFGGLPFFLLDAQLVSKRTAPLTVAGPKGVGARLEALLEAMFPGSSGVERKFPLDIVELDPDRPVRLVEPPMSVACALMRHPSGAPALGLRVVCDDRTIACTGDTEWVDEIVALAADADILVAEAYTFDRKTRFHMDFATLRARLPEIGARLVVLTHMSPDMLGHDPAILAPCLPAEDGLRFTL